MPILTYIYFAQIINICFNLINVLFKCSCFVKHQHQPYFNTPHSTENAHTHLTHTQFLYVSSSHSTHFIPAMDQSIGNLALVSNTTTQDPRTPIESSCYSTGRFNRRFHGHRLAGVSEWRLQRVPGRPFNPGWHQGHPPGKMHQCPPVHGTLLPPYPCSACP